MTKLIPLTKDFQAIVDDEDYDILIAYKWRANTGRVDKVYAVRTIKRGVVISMHQLILKAPSGFEVDHIDGDGLHNCRSNLRLATHADNCKNRQKNKKGTSKYKGVYWNEERHKWIAHIRPPHSNMTYLGSYESEEEAARAYDQSARHHHGTFARTNFTD